MDVVDTVVVDMGSSVFRVGLAGDDIPSTVIPPLIGVPGHGAILMNVDNYVGQEAVEKRSICKMYRPIEKGIITNWYAMEKIIRHIILHKLEVNIEESNFIFADSPLNTLENKYKLSELMFETYNIPFLFIGNTASMSLFSNSITTGTVLQSGYDISTCVSIHEGHMMSKSIFSSDIGGYDCSKYLTDKLYARHNNNVTWYPSIIDEIKKQHGYVALDYEQEMLNDISNIQRTYNHTNGNSYSIERERYCCSEVLFQPSMIGKECSGIHHILNDSITNSASDLQPQLYRNIILSGGTSLFTGFQKRLEKEMTYLQPKKNYKIKLSSDKENSTWVGASILGCLQNFTDSYLKSEDYYEYGTKIMKNKYF